MGALFGCQLTRKLHIGGRKQIAVLGRFANNRHAVALEPEHLPVLRGRRNLQAQRFSVDRLHVYLAAKNSCRQRNLHPSIQILTLALEVWMRRDADTQVQIAGGTTAAPRLAFAGNAHTRVVADPGGNSDVDRVRLTVQPHREAAQSAVVGVLKSELKLLFDVTSGTGARTRGAVRASTHIAAETSAATTTEKRLEEVGERAPVPEHLPHFLFSHRPIAAASRLAPEANVPARLTAEACAAGRHVFVRTPIRAELVVFFALLGIAKDLVRLVDLLELRLSSFVAWIDVRVVLARQLPERLLQILVGGGLRDAQGGVVVLEVHGQSRSVPSRGQACVRSRRVPGRRAAGRRAPTMPRLERAVGSARRPRRSTADAVRPRGLCRLCRQGA